MPKKPFLIFFRHHKAAGTWMSSICREVCDYAGLRFAYLGSAREARHYGRRASDCKRIKDYRAEGIGFISYGNAHMDYIKDLEDFKGFNLVRDPRDMVVSGYFSHLHSHPIRKDPDLIEHRRGLQSLTKEEGLLLEINFMKGIFTRMEGWNYSLSNVLMVKFEEITQKPYQKIPEIFKFLELVEPSLSFPKNLYKVMGYLAGHFNKQFVSKRKTLKINTGKIPLGVLLLIIYKHRFYAMANGRNLGEEDVRSHYRKGVAGDWKNHFNEEHKRIFKQRHADLLIRLGYEADNSW